MKSLEFETSEQRPGHLFETSSAGPASARRMVEPFVVRHYIADERPCIKGNGFDGLSIGESRDEADDFVAFLNHQFIAVTGVHHTTAPTEVVVPDGYKLVMVPDEAAPDEPDWDECKRQAEVSTGLKVEPNTFSILKREVRRWIAHKSGTTSRRTSIAWENFPAYLIDHFEGETISEEGLQLAVSRMLQDPKYTAPLIDRKVVRSCNQGCNGCEDCTDDDSLETGEADAREVRP